MTAAKATKRRTPDALPSSKTENSERYALFSVSDKTGIVEFAKKISKLGYKIISTGGTAKVLVDSGLKIIPIQEVTGNPESFDGRMKTISFQVEGGILFDRTNSFHVEQARELKVPQIDLVIANLYPFEQTISDSKVTIDRAVENIDVGGPTMVRAAAKNHKNVLVIVDPNDYEAVGKALKTGTVDQELRRALAAKAFGHLSFYDSQIALFLREGEDFPGELTLAGRKTMDLRYGENPHQRGAVYIEPNTNSSLANLKLIAGRELSGTNITDINAGLELVRMFSDDIAAVVVKHNSPCGIALGKTSAQALRRAIEADPKSAFGGVIVLNTLLDIEAAKVLADFKEDKGQMDIVSAPQITEEAAALIVKLRKSTGIYTFGDIPKERSQRYQIKPINGGWVLQDWDDSPEASFERWKVVTEEQPTPKQIEQMRIAWKMIGRIKSNTIIILDRDIPMTRGIGSGQTSRIGSVEIALAQAGEHSRGGILASDSFFPFGDSVKSAADAGISAIIQQGGSVNDKASIDAANSAKIPMVFTGERKFWH